MKASQIVYKPVGLALGAVSGVLVSGVFKQVWKKLGHEKDAPDATDEQRSWREVLPHGRPAGCDLRRSQGGGRPRRRRRSPPPDRHLARLTSRLASRQPCGPRRAGPLPSDASARVIVPGQSGFVCDRFAAAVGTRFAGRHWPSGGS